MRRSVLQTGAVATEAQVMAFYVSLGGRVKRGRNQANLSQADLAQRLGLTRTSIANLEAGRQRPSAHHAAMIANILQVPIQDLLPNAPATVDPMQEAREEMRSRARSWAGTHA